MKLIGKQIVVELPEKDFCKEHPGNDKTCIECALCRSGNATINEVARMNPAWEVDEENIKIILEVEKALFRNQTWSEFRTKVAHALASNPSAWMKRKNEN